RATGKLRYELRGNGAAVSSHVFSSDGRLLVSGGKDGTVRLWNPRTGQPQGELVGLPKGEKRVAISPDNQTLAITGEHNAVRLYDLRSQQLRTLVPDGIDHWFPFAAFSPDGKMLVSNAG